MFPSYPRSLSYALSIQIIILAAVNSCLGATFNAKTQFSWVDSSCDSVIDKVNVAGDDYNALVKAAIANLEGGSPSTELGKGTLVSYFGTPVGQLINAKYGRLQSTFAAQPIPLGLYCDGTAFEWVTTYQEGPKKGQDVPNGGQWHSMDGRYNPAEGPLYLDGTKTPERTSICQTPQGKSAQGVSSVGGKHIILCPDAFAEPISGAFPTTEQTLGTSLDTLTSTGAVLLHEATHCILSTTDLNGAGYKVNGVLLTARISSQAQKNADTWMYYAMASLAAKNAWVVGLAQAVDNFGPKAPQAPPSTGKRDTLFLGGLEARALAADEPTNLLAMADSPILEARAQDSHKSQSSQGSDTVTVTVTVTKDCSGNNPAGSTSGGSSSAGATGHHTTGTGHHTTGTGHHTTGTGSHDTHSHATGTKGTGSRANHVSDTATVSNTNTASGFTTVKSKGGGGYIGPVPLSAEPASITAALVSESSVNVIGLTTFSHTTTPTPVVIKSSVSSNGHTEKTNGVGPFPIFWSHTCWFCPPGLCLSCGIELDLPPGIYPPGSIDPPPGWTGPLPTITIGKDGTPIYDEDEPQETNKEPSNTANSKTKKTSTTPGKSSATKTRTSSSATSASSSGFNYIFETPAIYSEVSDTIPFSSVSAVVASEFAANSIDGYGGASGTNTGGASTTASSTKKKSQPASTASSPTKHVRVTSSTTDKRASITPTPISAVPPAFTCTSSMKHPSVSGYPCLCQGLNYCSQAGGGCAWTTVPAAEDCCLDCE